MADFQSWSQETLAKLAADQQAEIVRLNNLHGERLRIIRDLMIDFERMADMFCCKATRSDAWRTAARLFDNVELTGAKPVGEASG